MTVEPQSSDAVLLVRPAGFTFNPETAATNAFSSNAEVAAERVLAEFERVRQRLEGAGVEVLVLSDEPEPAKPDAVFPNNWVSFHADGTIVLYPMAAPSRRVERNPEPLRQLLTSRGFEIRRTVDLSPHEREGHFLEGTGSLILDRPSRRAYASLSARSDPAVIAEFDRDLGYSTHVFRAADERGRPIYHTNVLMSLGTRFAVLCVDAVANHDRRELILRLEETRTLVPISFGQMKEFACNIIELRSRSGDPVIVISSRALAALHPEQRRQLGNMGELLDVDIPTIETVGGGGIRCMIADIHLPRVR